MLYSCAAVCYALANVNPALVELKIKTLGIRLPLFQLTRLCNLKKLDLRWAKWRGNFHEEEEEGLGEEELAVYEENV